MIAERDRALTYYVDTSVWNQLTHQPEPGLPEFVARLKRARDEGQAHTYLSRHLVQELVAAFVRKPDIGRRLFKTVQAIVLRGCLVKDSPVLKEQDVRHLVDPSVSTDPLEPRGCLDVQKMTYAVDVFAQDGPLDPKWEGFCAQQRQKAYEYKTQYLDPWRQLVEEDRKKFDMDSIPEDHTLDRFLGDSNSTETKLAMVELWTPKSLKSLMPLPELARRLDETVSFRGMLFYLTSFYFWKVLKNEPLDHGDGFDAHHGLMAANFDVFVCKDANSRKYAEAGCRNGQRVVTLEEFVKDLG